MDRKVDVVVAGGGLAGLAAAALLARSGRTVAVLERSGQPGGRGRTRAQQGFLFNVGPHALYRGGAAYAVLRELEVPFAGRRPAASRALGLTDGAVHRLPAGPWSLLATRMMGAAAKWELARVLRDLPRLEAGRHDGASVQSWMNENVRHEEVADLLGMLIRVATYSNDPARASAGAALAQVQLALGRGVLYLDGGWQTLVDGLAARARQAGVRIETGAAVTALEHDGRVRGVRTADGALWTAPAVISTLPAAALAALPGLEGTATAAQARDRTPVRAATLDLGLRRLPRPEALVAFGLTRPLYFSVHSAAARLAPEGAALVHAAFYLGPDAPPPNAIEAELVAMVDRLQPGWTDEVIERRFVPELMVTNAVPLAREGGLAGRPAVEVPERPGLFLAGDWVGSEGQLADASFASARAAARAVAGPARAAAA